MAGYLNFGARFYDPKTGFFLSPDPKEEQYFGINPYLYCGGDPVNLVDVEGRNPKLFIETTGFGHVFVMTGDLEHPTIYTYGRSGALYSESLGNKSFTGEGVLTILSMKDATDYLADRNASGISYIIFEYKGSDKNIDAYYQSLFENGVSATYGVSKGKEAIEFINHLINEQNAAQSSEQ